MVKLSREQSALLRRRVLDAAATELAVNGAAAIAVTTVAQRAGVATSAVAHRFPTKDHLVDAVVAERLEPTAGLRVDVTTDWLWGPPRPAPTRRGRPIDTEALDACYQILVAAAFPAGPRQAARALLERRSEHAGACRAAAPSDSVRPDPDPTAQTLLPFSVDVGTWLLASGLGRSPRHESGRLAAIRSAVRIEPPAPKASTTIRRLPRASARPARHSHDRLGTTLLDVTGDAVAGHGFAAITVAGIARCARSSTGAVYNRFTGKGGLLAECLLATNATGVDDRSAAIRVESLRVAPSDPEVAAAVRTALGHAIAVEARALAVAHRDGGSPMALDPSSAAALRTAFSLGHWVMGRILDRPDEEWRASATRVLEHLAAPTRSTPRAR